MAGERRSNNRQGSSRDRNRIRRLHLLLLGLGVLLAYASALPGGFIWTDDTDLVGGRLRLHQASDLPAAFTHSLGQFRMRNDGTVAADARGTWQPTTLLAYSVGWLAWGECAPCWHLGNLLLHFTVVIGLYTLGRHLMSQRRRGARYAFWAALLFAVHPAGVDSVTWIGGQPILLAAGFSVWSMVLLTRLQATTKSRRAHLRRWLAGIFLLALAAYTSHESSFVLPVAALLVAAFEAVERKRPAFSGIAPTRYLALGLTLAALGLVLGWRTLVVAAPEFAGTYPSDSIAANLGTGLRHFWSLLERTLVPGEPVVSDVRAISNTWQAGEIAAALGLPLLLAVTGLLLYWGSPVGLGIAWFLVWILPWTGLFPSERYHSDLGLYLAGWGLVFSVVFATMTLWRPLGRQLVPGSEAIIFVPIAILMVVITGLSNARWWDQRALFESELNSDPHYMAGRLELARLALQADRPLDTMNHVLNAMESARDTNFTGYWDPETAHELLARAQLVLEFRTDALASVDRALALRPTSFRLRRLRAQILVAMNRLDEASAVLVRLLDERPGNVRLRGDLGVVRAGQQRHAEAAELLADLPADKAEFAHHRALAEVAVAEHAWQRAALHLENALDLRDDAAARAHLAWAQWQAGRRDAARTNLDLALQGDGGSNPFVARIAERMKGDPMPRRHRQSDDMPPDDEVASPAQVPAN